MIDPNETICTIRWTVEDLIALMHDRGIDCSEENIRRLLDRTPLRKALVDRSVEEGWEILEDLVYTNLN